MYTKFTYITIFCSLVSFMLLGCSKEEDRSTFNEEANITLSVRAASSSINEDVVNWEDRVEELRMIVFDSQNGAVIFNQKLYFPNGFGDKSRAVRMKPGTYDFYFIANEAAYKGEFINALDNLSNKSDLSTDSRFTDLKYNPDFKPDGTTDNGLILMSAIYNNIVVISGGTENNPLPLSLPTTKVELIRSLAKVEVIFRKKTSGSTIPENTITGIRLQNVASTLSVPPYDNYYTGQTSSTTPASLSGLNYANDSIGAVTFYIPEFLIAENNTGYTELNINNKSFSIFSDQDKVGITEQRRTTPVLSDNSVIRNYHYQINAYVNGEGGVSIKLMVKPWKKDKYTYLFHGDIPIVIPPVTPTDTSIIIPTDCGKIEIISQNEYLSQGLQGAYNDVVNYYDPAVGGPVIYKGDPPYHCEKKYGVGWRLMNSCELLSFLTTLDIAYNVWMSNTWDAYSFNNSNPDLALPYYPVSFRREAQALLEKLTGVDLSSSVYQDSNNWQDAFPDKKLNIIDEFFTPGDIMVRPMDFGPGEWPFANPATQEDWFYYEASIQVKAFWYPNGYIDPSNRDNWEKLLYAHFQRYDYGSTVSRCVRVVE